jgi:gliding motility-associated-like protein
MKAITYLVTSLFVLGSYSSFGKTHSNTLNAKIDNRKYFIENKGQFTHQDEKLKDSILFAYIGAKERYFFTNKGVVIIWNEKEQKNNPAVYLQKIFSSKEKLEEMEREGEFLKNKRYAIYARWNNTQSNNKVLCEGKTSHYYTFRKSTIKAQAYTKLIYKNIYPFIDIEYTIPNDSTGIKYNIILNPGANIDDLELEYLGDYKSIEKSVLSGDIVITTKSDKIGLTEHSPITYYASGQTINSSSYLTKNKIKFKIDGITKVKEKIIIDPWVSPITVQNPNIGYDVDYDANNNLFVYVSGASAGVNFISKYNNATGALMWTHNVTFNSGYDGNFLVEKNTARVYVSEGFNASAATVYRLDPNGVPDGFSSVPNTSANEFWNLGFNCAGGGSILALGGGTTSNLSGGIINTVSGNIAIQNFTGITGQAFQDIVSFAFDNQGRLFTVFASASVPAVNNRLIRVNATLNGPVYTVPTGYMTYNESANHLENSAWGGNQHNGLSVNDNYLIYYDGLNLKAFNPNTGAVLGSTTVAGHTAVRQGGVVIDDCDNVYIGGNNGTIRYYNFNGSTFNFLGTINLGWTGAQTNVFDIVLNRATNQLYVSGYNNVCIVNAVVTNCNVLSTVGNCPSPGNGTATTTLNTNVSNPDITYTWTNSSGTVISQTNNSNSLSNTINGLGSGTYYVTVQISAPCGPVFTDSVVIICNSNCSVSATSTNITCFGLNNGTATATNPTGTGPFLYSWNTTPVQNTQTASNLSPGTYTVTLTDATGCTATADVTITEPTQLNVNTNFTNPTSCNSNDGTATANANGGTAPYNYSWNSTPVQNTPTATNLPGGNFIVTVTDANGCVATSQVTLTAPASPTINLVSQNNVSCFGGNNGSATVNPSGGTAPLNVSWNTIPVQNGNTAVNLSAGNYTATVTDANNCSATVNVTITEPTQLNANITPTHINCFGASTGSATANPNGGTPPYSYSWNTTPVQNTQTATNLSAGNYTVTITDANNCVINQNITINEPAQLTVNTAFQDVTCFGQCNGQAISAPQGGTQPYNYSWTLNGNPVGSNNPVVNNACAGNYTVTVTDANGCLITGNTTVSEPAQIIINNVASTPELCPGDCLGTITINATNALNFSINGGQSYQPSNQFNNLCAGNYNIVVQGINNCQTTSTATVSQPIAVIADFDFTPASTNIFNPNINFINTSQNAVSYLWDIGGLTTNTQTNTSYTFPDIPGAYQVCLTAYDLNGCNNTHCETVIIDDVFLIYVPNAFTPTGDGINDVFIPIINGIIPESYQFMIFNRWGELIFETNNPQKGWDGTHKGLNSQQDVYVWKIIVKDAVSGKKRDFKGHVTLLR